MNLKTFRFETDSDGIALLTWDMPGRAMNVINPEFIAELDQVIDKVAADAAIKADARARAPTQRPTAEYATPVPFLRLVQITNTLTPSLGASR